MAEKKNIAFPLFVNKPGETGSGSRFALFPGFGAYVPGKPIPPVPQGVDVEELLKDSVEVKYDDDDHHHKNDKTGTTREECARLRGIQMKVVDVAKAGEPGNPHEGKQSNPSEVGDVSSIDTNTKNADLATNTSEK